MQKNIHDDVLGDCLRACICSLLEISDKDMPNFVEYEDYIQKIYDFFRMNNLNYIICSSDKEPEDVDYYMVWGTSPRGVKHSVIYKQSKLVHDPHPKGGGVTDIYAYVWLEKYD